MTRQLFLDCDGVLADFHKGATARLGLDPDTYEARHGAGRFWQKLASAPDFYFGLPLMSDAMELFEGVRHLHPIILTGLPGGNWAADQKVRWAAQYFPGTRIITTLARNKRDHARRATSWSTTRTATAISGRRWAASSSATVAPGNRWPSSPLISQ
jgi:hypothetical protein